MSQALGDILVPIVAAGVGAIAAILGNAVGLHRDRIRQIMIELLVVDLPELAPLMRQGIDEARPKIAEIARKATVAGDRARRIGYEMMAWAEVWRKQDEDPTSTWHRQYFDAPASISGDVRIHLHRLRNELGLIAEYRSQSIRGRLGIRTTRSVAQLWKFFKQPIATSQSIRRSRRRRIRHKQRMKRRPTL